MEMTGTALLVHGGWHGPWCWEPVLAELPPEVLAPRTVELPMTGLSDDVAALREAIDRAKEDGPVVVVGHSYAGAVLNCGGHDADRLIYIAAIVPGAGQSVRAAFGASAGEIPGTELRGDAVWLTEPVLPLLYDDCAGDRGAWLMARLRGFGLRCETESLDVPPAWTTVSSTYVVCTRDRLLPPVYQRQRAAVMAASTELVADHSPFASATRQLAHLVTQASRWR
jgi:pimeloyl-ACP methyl ester carboxylesterase